MGVDPAPLSEQPVELVIERIVEAHLLLRIARITARIFEIGTFEPLRKQLAEKR